MLTIRQVFIALPFISILAAVVPSTAATAVQEKRVEQSGQGDFDFEIGTWTTRVRVLRNPLTGDAPNWSEYEGTSIVRPLLNGRANFVELSVRGTAGQIEGGALRLYNIGDSMLASMDKHLVTGSFAAGDKPGSEG